MKTSIPSDVWEKKRALIAKLYKDEEWPLKQVIKQIRSENFNPSETQLRSRLKKWRVTKPSRQTRKKSGDDQQKSAGDESGNEDASPKSQTPAVSPRTPLHSTHQVATPDHSVSEPEWYMTQPVYAPTHGMPVTISLDEHNVSNGWAHHVVQQPSPSPSSEHRSPIGSPSYNPPHSPVDNLLINSAHTYAGPEYVTTDPCLQSPISTTAPIQWTNAHWYPVAETIAQHPTVPFYTDVPLSPALASPVDQTMNFLPSQASGRVSPYPQQYPHHLQQATEQKFVERKTPLSSKAQSHSVGLMTPPPTQYSPNGMHPAMCAPIYLYAGQELPLVSTFRC